MFFSFLLRYFREIIRKTWMRWKLCDTYGMWPWSAGIETTRIDTNIWGPLVQDEQLFVQVDVQCTAVVELYLISLSHFMTATKCSTACLTPGSKPLTTSSCLCHWPTTGWRWLTSSPSAAGYRGEKKVCLDFTLACPPQSLGPRQFLHPRLGLPSEVVDGDVLHVVLVLLCGQSQLPVLVLHSLEIGQTKNELFCIDPKRWWLLEVMMAIASWDLQRSMTQVLICWHGWFDVKN